MQISRTQLHLARALALLRPPPSEGVRAHIPVGMTPGRDLVTISQRKRAEPALERQAGLVYTAVQS